MTAHRHHKPYKPNRTLARLFHRWHRRIGVVAALFVVWIVISGWLLNHTDSLNLAKRQIHSPALAHWYQLDTQTPSQTLNSQTHWLVASNDALILDGKTLSSKLSSPIGIAENQQLIAIGSSNQLLLLNPQGESIDNLSDSNLPLKPITKIGSGCDGIVISDNAQTLSTQDGLDWQTCPQSIVWSTTQTIKPAQLTLINTLLVPDISVEKLIMDLHTGRFFGHAGVYVVDAVGLCLMLLALSGLWLFFRMGKR